MEDTIVEKTANETNEQLQYIKGVVESLLFVNEKPVTLDQIKKVLEAFSGDDIKKIIFDLQKEYEARKCGMMIVEIAGGFQMLSNPAYASYLRNFYKTKHKEKLSKPALESMAIIAYKQPVTRTDVELIRGVNSDGVMAHLLSKELIKVVGRKDVPGHPYLFGTTKQFLEYFGLKSLDDLPTLEEFPTLQPAAEGDMTETAGILPLVPGEFETGETGGDVKEDPLDRTQANDAEVQEEGQASEEPPESIVAETERQDVENESEEPTQEN